MLENTRLVENVRQRAEGQKGGPNGKESSGGGEKDSVRKLRGSLGSAIAGSGENPGQ